MEDHHDPPPSSPPPPPTKTCKLTATSISSSKPTSVNYTSSLGLLPTFLLKPCTTTLPPNYILQDISFTAYPSQILAIVGPSGAEKSTLLDILAARTSPTTGSFVLNSHPIYPSSYRKLSAYVPQHDAYLPFLTVSEMFTFIARLLLPSACPGSKSLPWLSGGDRKRVSIGLSLLHDPGILLLDEPTSGLDSGSTFNNFMGSPFTVPPQLNALEHAMEVLNQLPESKPISKNPPSDHDHCSSNHAVEKTKKMRYKSSRVHEILTPSRRFWKIIYRTKQLLLTNTLEALIVGFALGTIYINIGYDKQSIRKTLGLFAFTLTFLLSSTTETLPIFVNERPILIRETSSGVYRLSSYLIANTLVFLPYLLVISIIHLGHRPHGELVCPVLKLGGPHIHCGDLLGNCAAGWLLPLLGVLHGEGEHAQVLGLHALVVDVKYALDALLINEYSCLATKCFVRYEESKSCMVTGHDVLEKRGLHEGQRWNNVYVLVGFLCSIGFFVCWS
ncbi:hypothetical protein Cgig2_005095 [Carnegiea gigantea]|uniref:ABC transporter domain-containing protein n=1 Tax=Carnegiea gigantea TaxID=171969 RepID=A0A9Q1QSQ9_9CARY|nr:hypothetical protein Cgig2_005095 [Carnegiea gigantea]